MKTLKWINVEFESSSTKTPQFAEFVKDFRSDVKSIAKSLNSTSILNVGHFYCSGFISNNDKHLYYSTGDVRDTNWHKNILIRRTKSTSDYSGEENYFCSISDLKDKFKSFFDIREV